MQRQGDEIHIETDEARGGSSPNVVRWVLAIGLFAAIALLSVIWITGAATQDAAESQGTADDRERVLRDYGSQGGVLSTEADDLDAPEVGGTPAPGTPPRVENQAADAPAAAEAPAN